MSTPSELADNEHWRVAVWSLRAGFAALVVAFSGLVVVLSGSTPWILAVGIVLWLVAAAVTVTEVLWARRELPEPRPGLWPMRFMVLHDAVRASNS